MPHTVTKSSMKKKESKESLAPNGKMYRRLKFS